MKKSLAFVLALVIGAVGCAAESNEPAPAPAKKAASSTSPNEPVAGSTTKSTDSCITKDAPANEKGVGAYCDKTTKCTSGFCTADFDEAGSATFCTKLCSADSDCGAGAYCYHDPRGSACVLSACKPQ